VSTSLKSTVSDYWKLEITSVSEHYPHHINSLEKMLQHKDFLIFHTEAYVSRGFLIWWDFLSPAHTWTCSVHYDLRTTSPSKVENLFVKRTSIHSFIYSESQPLSSEYLLSAARKGLWRI
jgi:hypothetical protein